jgi:succinate dehydrogenase flavin-adding protein (antitoxin of CptAB toxin-antitoxin module)
MNIGSAGNAAAAAKMEQLSAPSGGGGNIAAQIRIVMNKITELAEFIQKNAAGMSKEEQQSVQEQMAMLQQQLADLIQKQAQEAQRRQQMSSADSISAVETQGKSTTIDIRV